MCVFLESFFLQIFTHDFMSVVFFIKSVSFTEGKLWYCDFSLKVQNPEVKNTHNIYFALILNNVRFIRWSVLCFF